MFKELPEGQTHSFNDGCGCPEHNLNNPKENIIVHHGKTSHKLGADCKFCDKVKKEFKASDIEESWGKDLEKRGVFDDIEKEKWEKELSELVIIVPDGIMEGCLVYHEATKDFIAELVELSELRGVSKILDNLWEGSHNVKDMSGRIRKELVYFFGENWSTDMYDFIGNPSLRPELPRPLKEIKK